MTSPSGVFHEPPPGWFSFGYHAPLATVPPLVFSEEVADDGLPLWERLATENEQAGEQRG